MQTLCRGKSSWCLLAETDAKLTEIYHNSLPNIPADSVPVGVMRWQRWGSPLGNTSRIWLRKPKALTGFRWSDLVSLTGNAGLKSLVLVSSSTVTWARLERVITPCWMNMVWKLAILGSHSMVKRRFYVWYWTASKFKEDTFELSDTNYVLIPQLKFPDKLLPRWNSWWERSSNLLHCYGPSFRSEAGLAGRYSLVWSVCTQFHKVEMVNLLNQKNHMMNWKNGCQCWKYPFKNWNLPYRGSLHWRHGLLSGQIYTWSRFQQTPTWNLKLFQYRRFQARCPQTATDEADGKVKLLHTLNGSDYVGRTVAAILENYQNEARFCGPFQKSFAHTWVASHRTVIKFKNWVLKLQAQFF